MRLIFGKRRSQSISSRYPKHTLGPLFKCKFQNGNVPMVMPRGSERWVRACVECFELADVRSPAALKRCSKALCASAKVNCCMVADS